MNATRARPRQIVGAWVRVDDAPDGLWVSWGLPPGRGADWEKILGAWNETFPPGTPERRWISEEKEWFLPPGERVRLRAWACRVFPSTGIAWRKLAPDPPPPPPTQPRGELTAAYARLHLLPTAPVELVESARRTLARLYHPDAGGDGEAMVAVNVAADIILSVQKQGVAS